jgi:hypothetical protein
MPFFRNEIPEASRPEPVKPAGTEDFTPIQPEFSFGREAPHVGRHSEQASEAERHGHVEPNSYNWLLEGGKSFMRYSIVEPLNGVTQLLNHLTGSELLPKIDMHEPETAAGSKEWFAQTIGGGAGYLIPFLALEALTARAGKLPAFVSLRQFADHIPVARSFMGMTGFSPTAAAGAKLVMDAGIYGFALTPVRDEKNNFWQQRAVNSLSSSICFGTQFAMAHSTMAGLEKLGSRYMNLAPAANPLVGSIGKHLLSDLSGATAAGFVGAQTHSLLASGKFADAEQLENAISRFAVTSAALDLVHVGHMAKGF